MPNKTTVPQERHTLEVCLGVPFLDDEPKKRSSRVPLDWRKFFSNRRTVMKREEYESELIPPGEDYVAPLPTGTTLHARPQQTLDGDGGIEPEIIYDDGEIYE